MCYDVRENKIPLKNIKNYLLFGVFFRLRYMFLLLILQLAVVR